MLPFITLAFLYLLKGQIIFSGAQRKKLVYKCNRFQNRIKLRQELHR